MTHIAIHVVTLSPFTIVSHNTPEPLHTAQNTHLHKAQTTPPQGTNHTHTRHKLHPYTKHKLHPYTIIAGSKRCSKIVANSLDSLNSQTFYSNTFPITKINAFSTLNPLPDKTNSKSVLISGSTLLISLIAATGGS